MKYAVFICLFFASICAQAAEPYFHSVKAKKGDGIFSLLRRYHLVDESCNRKQFLELNNLSYNDILTKGKEYKLPIKIFNYNGKSIRSSIGIDDYKQALRIKEYNEKILSDNLRKTHFTNSKILWVPYHELFCNKAQPIVESKKEAKPETPKTNITEVTANTEVKTETKIEKSKAAEKKYEYASYDLFGEANSKYPLKSKEYKNEVYYIVSGHGGPDPGAMCTDCPSNICEDEYAYDVCLRLARELMSHGATVHMIIQDKNDGIRSDAYLKCDKDERCNGSKLPLRPKARLRQRAGAINHLYKSYRKKGVKKQVAIMVHVDAYANKNKRRDVYFYHHATSKSSKKLALSLQSTFKEKYEMYQSDRGYTGNISTRNLFMINYTLPSSVFVELGNIHNKKDRQRLIKEGNRQLIAEWLFEGLVKTKF